VDVPRAPGVQLHQLGKRLLPMARGAGGRMILEMRTVRTRTRLRRPPS